jgi:hypothetical protein
VGCCCLLFLFYRYYVVSLRNLYRYWSLCGQRLRGDTKNTWKLGILIGLAISFWTGSFVSYYAVKARTTHALFFNAEIFFLVFFIDCWLLSYRYNLNAAPLQALRGTLKWQKALHGLDIRSTDVNVTVKSDEAIMQLFREIDKDGDGNVDVDVEELTDRLSKLGLDLPPSCIQYVQCS